MSLRVSAVDGLPEIAPGDDLAALIARCGEELLAPGAVVAVAHKLVSKAEGRIVTLADVTPSPLATSLAEDRDDGDARHVQVIIDESEEIVRADRGILICRTRHGFVCANAGVDRSNAPDDAAILLPVDPDASARALRAELERLTSHAPLAVVVTDSFGRAWRRGQVDTAIGAAGIPEAVDHAGRSDRAGRPLVATLPALADEIAAAAGLVRGKASGDGVVVLTGLEHHVTADDGPGAAALIRPTGEDLFR
ncbi:MAG: coenzyme F420-0:L-glutamate ligase [Solirubrobacteraceae bacterium]|nr:coenzyme F420-0:L-glutamate ligase [Solirubrobacteraceae bacterium]